MIVLYSIIAIYIAWIWVDYYRLIEIYEKENLKYFILTFFLGSASVLIVTALNRYLLDNFSFRLNGDFTNDFLYCVFKIGLLEEFAKTVPFIIVYFLFKEQFNEPIDYLAFICISALGFSAAEDVLYFQSHGPYIINNRAILATVGHMFDTSLIAYGIIRYKYYYKGVTVVRLIPFFFLAALSHGFYDFWLLYSGAADYGWLITLFYFLITISVFAVILNNALNNSSFFTYKKVVDSNKVVTRLLTYYAVVFLIQLLLLIYIENFTYAFKNLTSSIYLTGFIIGIAVVRLSRFKLIKNRWQKVTIELPFEVYEGDSFINIRSAFFRLKIKGEAYNEVYINNYYEEFFSLNPLSSRSSFIEKARLAFIDRKVFLKNDETFYCAKIFFDENKERYEIMLLKPKTNDMTMVNEKYPIVAILKMDNVADLENTKLSARNFKFKEWAYIKPHTLPN